MTNDVLHCGFKRTFSALFLLVCAVALSLLSAPLSSLTASASGDEKVAENPMTAKARLEISAQDPKSATVIVDLDLADPYKAYADRFKLVVEEPTDVKLEPFQLTPVVQFMDTFSKKMKDGIKKKGTMTAKVKLPNAESAKVLKLKLTYQACTTEHCLFPKHIVLTPGAMAAKAASIASVEPKVETKDTTTPSRAPATSGGQSSEFEKAMGAGLLSAVLFMFVAGFLTSLTPCIYPMIPITLAILGASERRSGGRADTSTKHSKLRSFFLSIFYVLGIGVTYSILGVTAASTGALFGSALSNIYVVSGLALLFVAMGLSMYGLYEIQAPAFIRDRVGQGKSETGYFSSFAMGLAAGVVASPCIGPVLVSVLAYIAQTQDKALGLILLFSFAMGMGVLFVALGTSSSLLQKVPKAGAWMDTVKFVFGTTMIGMAIYYIAPVYPDWAVRAIIGLSVVLIASAYGAFAPATTGASQVKKGAAVAAFCIGIALMMVSTLEKSGVQFATAGGATSISPGNVAKLGWQSYSDEALAAAIEQKKPVLVDFWADWCGACHELEEKTFPDDRIQALSKNFVLFKIDATNDSPEIDKLKKTYSVMGLPTMVFYDTNGQIRTDLTVTGFMNADDFLDRMRKANEPIPRAAASEQ
ncbi:MAG: protein-disulfide reductase DsbD [Deltaproteobacteria bacterium]|nr:protein-disulfide reductase DsbD [Deltaproteobacteria bacterium]